MARNEEKAQSMCALQNCSDVLTSVLTCNWHIPSSCVRAPAYWSVRCCRLNCFLTVKKVHLRLVE